MILSDNNLVSKLFKGVLVYWLIQDYLSTCTPDAEDYCNVPVNISANDGGLTLDSLNIDYSVPSVISIIYPINDSIFSKTEVDVNYTYSNETEITNCWYTNNSWRFFNFQKIKTFFYYLIFYACY